MDRTEAEASLRVLIALARADGRVTSEEERVIAAAGEHEGRALAVATAGDIDLEAELAKVRSAEARRLTLKAALAVASVDGQTTPAEHRVLERVFAALGDAGTLALRVVEPAALQHTSDIRRELDACSDAFMHAVARANQKGGLDSKEYDRLLADLETRKHAIVERVFEQRISAPPPVRRD